MKFIKQLRPVVIILCILQVCLLSLASVSPQIHAHVFHVGQLIDADCLESHANCAGLPGTGSESSESDQSTDEENDFCSVVLFEEGVTSMDGSVTQLLERSPTITSIAIKSSTIFASHYKDKVQARAPPVG